MKVQLEKKVVVITGAAGGLGSQMARSFAEEGAIVIASDLHGAEAVAEEIQKAGGTCYSYAFDITNRASVNEKMAEIAEKHGKIDVLVNNAGINVGPNDRKDVSEFSGKWWDAINAVDLTGTFNCSQAALRNMNPAGGNIINISSIGGIVPLRDQCAFAAAKGGVVNLTKAMAIELAPKNIRVNCIAPGSVGIEITNTLWQDDERMRGLLAHIPMGRQATPTDIANAVVFIASPLAAYITGAILPVDGGWIAGGFARNF